LGTNNELLETGLKKTSFKSPNELVKMLQLGQANWNGKKPQGGGDFRPVILGKTAAERVLEDRR
jgi:hypothetical protein